MNTMRKSLLYYALKRLACEFALITPYKVVGCFSFMFTPTGAIFKKKYTLYGCAVLQVMMCSV